MLTPGGENIQQILIQYLKLANILANLMNDSPYEKNDSRYAIWEYLFSGVLWSWEIINSLDYLTNSPKPQVKTKSGIPRYDQVSLKKQFEHTSRVGFISYTLFKLEHLLSRINENMLEKSDNDKFSSLLAHVLKKAEVDNWKQKVQSIRYISEIRNSLHGDGFYSKNKKRLPAKIHNENVLLIPGQKIQKAGWLHFDFYIREIIMIIEELLSSEKIKEIHKIENPGNKDMD